MEGSVQILSFSDMAWNLNFNQRWSVTNNDNKLCHHLTQVTGAYITNQMISRLHRKANKTSWKCKIKIWVTNSNPRVSSSNPWITNSDLRITSSNPWVTSFNPRVRRRKVQVARLKVRVGRLKAWVVRLKVRFRRLKARAQAIKPRVRW